MELGTLITQYRKAAGLTIDELVARSGVPKGTITKILGNTTKAPALETVRAIAHALGKTLADFDDTPVVSAEDPVRDELLARYDQLNQEGQEKLLDLADDLVSSGKYIKTAEDQLGEIQA